MWLVRSFKPFRFTCDFDNALDYQNIPSLGLYVHIPFCQRICAFCPYCKQPYNRDIAAAYMDSLLREIECVCAEQETKRVTSLYFGGGSPALVVDDLGRVVSALRKHFTITDGIGVELHPDDVTIETLRKLKAIGVTRISIGIQSFDTETLRKLGRADVDYSRVFSAIQEVPFDTVAMDFIFALEGQTFDSVKTDIDTAFANGANHIALYPFIDFAFAKSGIRKMSAPEMKKLLYRVSAHCEGQGYVRDSIWTFGKPGVDKYSSMTRDNFLGFGCSSATLLANQFKMNTFSPEAYADRVNAGTLPTALTLRFTRRQRMVYWLFWRLYTTRLNPSDFETAFGVPLEKMYGFEFWLGRLFGLLKKEDGEYRLTVKGVFYYHHFEGYYTLAYIDRMWNVMRIVPFPETIAL